MTWDNKEKWPQQGNPPCVLLSYSLTMFAYNLLPFFFEAVVYILSHKHTSLFQDGVLLYTSLFC